MKSIPYICLCFLLALGACSKEKSPVISGMQSMQSLLQALSLTQDLSAEDRRVYNDLLNPDYTFGIIDNLNFGHFGTSQNFPIYLSGQTESNVTLILNNQALNPRQNGDWFLRDNQLKSYFGTDVDIDISIDGQNYQAMRYIPVPVQIQDLSKNSSIYIERTGNTLQWTVDPLSPVQKIALYYTLYSNYEYGSGNGAYSNGILLLDNNGSYDLAPLLRENAAKRISFQVASGNTFSFQHGQSKYLFNIASVDHHEYLVRN